MFFIAGPEVRTDLLVYSFEFVKGSRGRDDDVGSHKTLGACHLKGTGNKKGLPASVLPLDEFCIATPLRHVIQLLSYSLLFDIECYGNPFESTCRDSTPAQCIDNIDAFQPAPVNLFRLRYIHRPVHPLLLPSFL